MTGYFLKVKRQWNSLIIGQSIRANLGIRGEFSHSYIFAKRDTMARPLRLEFAGKRCIISPHEETGATPFIEPLTIEKPGCQVLGNVCARFNSRS